MTSQTIPQEASFDQKLAFHLLHPGLPAVERRLLEIVGSDKSPAGELAAIVVKAGGKRIRPALTLISSDFFKDNCDHEMTIDVASAIELIHMASIVHDDVIDGTSYRRKNRTLNAAFGNHVAILAGDLFLSKALAILSSHKKYEIINILAETVTYMSEAEIEQSLRAFNDQVTEAEYNQYIGKKTAHLMAVSCYAGLLAAGACEKAMSHMWHYGYYMGIAFQIIDDTLDLVGDQKTMGKTIWQDLPSGIITLPVIKGLSHPKAGPFLSKLIHSRKFDHERMNRVREILLEIGAIEYAREQARSYIRSAQERLMLMPPCEARNKLFAISELSLQRNA